MILIREISRGLPAIEVVANGEHPQRVAQMYRYLGKRAAESEIAARKPRIIQDVITMLETHQVLPDGKNLCLPPNENPRPRRSELRHVSDILDAYETIRYGRDFGHINWEGHETNERFEPRTFSVFDMYEADTYMHTLARREQMPYCVVQHLTDIHDENGRAPVALALGSYTTDGSFQHGLTVAESALY
jgi:hypothetical protein